MTELALKFVAKIIAGQSPESDAVSPLEAGLPFLQGNAEFGSISPTARWETAAAPKRAKPGDILVSVRAPVGAVNIADVEYGIGRGLCAVRPAIGHSRFFYWWLISCSEHLNSVATGSTFTAISASDIGDLRISVVDSAEQRAISDLLDRETAEIDAFISDQQELIELLSERRAATITHAVTKGLDRSASMKDSNVEWFGEVPRSWKMGQVKRVARAITDGAHISPETDGGVYPFVSTRDVRDGEINLVDSLRTTPETYAYMVRTGCQPRRGDVLFSKDGTVGRTAIVVSDEDFVVASSLIIISPNASVDSRFLNFLLMSTPVQEQISSFVKGAGLPRLSVINLTRMVIIVPPLAEQSAIANYLDHETAELDAAIADAREAIALSKERRAALISAAVTGKIDVRGLA